MSLHGDPPQGPKVVLGKGATTREGRGSRNRRDGAVFRQEEVLGSFSTLPGKKLLTDTLLEA